MEGPVTSIVDRNICSIALNRPECLNAVNNELVAELHSALRVANADPEVRAIVLSGNGRAFCTGNDLKEHMQRARTASQSEAEAVVNALQDITRQIVLSDKYVVGAIHGWAVGAGFEWAINCDFAVWADDAVGFFPELSWGLFPTGGVTFLLPQIVGPAQAREMLLFGERFNASELHETGIASRVESADKVLDVAMELARQIASLPEDVVSSLKQASTRRSAADLEEALVFEASTLVRCLMDPATTERIAAFEQEQKSG